MDTFDLKWPQTQATFYTDGWRCRIVWRQQGGPGGTIDNHHLCKRRLADSLPGAPYLLSALRARGYGNLAMEIESLAGSETVADETDKSATAPRPAAPARAARRPSSAVQEAEQLDAWLAGLDGDATFAETAARRSKEWVDLGLLDDEQLFLKVPGAGGKQEWVLKRTWLDTKRKAEYVAARHLRGILSSLAGRSPRPSAGNFEALLGACGLLVHQELSSATRSWRQHMAATPTH